jgi:hypothetical protein
MSRPPKTRDKTRSIDYEELSEGTLQRPTSDWTENFLWFPYVKPLLMNKIFRTKRMFGGLSIYRGPRLVLVLMEDRDRDKTYRGRSYSFAIWNGVLIPTEHKYHSKLIEKHPSLIQHPVLGKWLYLRGNNRKFSLILKALVRSIQRRDPKIGVNSTRKKTRKCRPVE